MLDDHGDIIVTSLKQYAYCPRITYHESILGRARPITYKMEDGALEHEAERRRARRRTLKQYGVEAGYRLFNVRLRHPKLGLTGMMDEVLQLPDGVMIPIDYKVARKVSLSHRLQICAYAMLLEGISGIHVPHGFIYLIPLHKTQQIKTTADLRQQTLDALGAIRVIIQDEMMPEPVRELAKCTSCEFRRFCNDVGR